MGALALRGRLAARFGLEDKRYGLCGLVSKIVLLLEWHGLEHIGV